VPDVRSDRLALFEPFEWLVIFHPHSKRWVEAICPGRWKHVSAVGFVPGASAWVYASWELARLRLAVIPAAEIENVMAPLANECGVLRVKRPDFDKGPWQPKGGLFCASMVAHLLGLRHGALLPDTLWRRLVANGAEIASDGRPVQPEGESARGDAGREERGGSG
jgi:hypothetical protein